MPRVLPVAAAPASGAAAYCSAARRIRGRYGARPVRRLRELRELSRRHDAERSTLQTPPPLPVTEPRSWRKFAGEVEARLEGPVLRHAQRRALLSTAQGMGVGRFEANLVIAAVQHERGRTRQANAPTPNQPTATTVGPLQVASLVLLVQSLIVWGAWWLLAG